LVRGYQVDPIAFACARCGAPLPVDPRSVEVACRPCGATTAVPADLRARALDYEASVRNEWADELEARRWALINAQEAGAGRFFLRWLYPFFLLLVFWFGLLASKPPLAGRAHPALIAAFVALSALAFSRLAAAFAAMTRPPSVPRLIASGLGACLACDAPVRFDEGAVNARCRHCGATSLPDPAFERAMLRSAMARVAPAVAERDRAEAAIYANIAEAGPIFGVGGKADPSNVAVVLMVLASIGLALLWGWLASRGPGTHHDTWWVGPALTLGAAPSVLRIRASVRGARLERRAFETFIGRPLGPRPLNPPAGKRSSGSRSGRAPPG
jgi:predicted RNA-binding Zn-ribbon protein involved in translation (DUF1610 family)